MVLIHKEVTTLPLDKALIELISISNSNQWGCPDLTAKTPAGWPIDQNIVDFRIEQIEDHYDLYYSQHPIFAGLEVGDILEGYGV